MEKTEIVENCLFVSMGLCDLFEFMFNWYVNLAQILLANDDIWRLRKLRLWPQKTSLRMSFLVSSLN